MYEGNWADLAAQGFLARVHCVEVKHDHHFLSCLFFLISLRIRCSSHCIVHKVQCCMPPSFLREYLMADQSAVSCPREVAASAWASALFRYRKRLWTLNPWKLVACKHLLQLHSMRRDKVGNMWPFIARAS
jgi:hypothetical protein